MKGLGRRADALQALRDSARRPFDLLVVGGGITGAGIALDAASRGLRVGLVERFDFASGTSSKSSKLVHGGLRYLEHGEFGLVREASVERGLLGRLAPHLVEPLPFVIPVSDRWLRARFGVGLWAYDALATFKNTALHKYVDESTVEQMVPALPRGKLRGGYVYYDSRTDDARLVVEVLVQAVRHGAVVCNYLAARDIEPSPRVCSVLVEETLDGDLFEVRARRVISAAGVWADRVEELARPGAAPRVRPSKGIHLSFSPEVLRVERAAAFVPDAERKRMLFVIPWLDTVIAGTTDTAYSGDLDHPRVEPNDRDYVLAALNSALGLDLGPEDIQGAWAGLRPLLQGKAGATADLSRNHAVYDIAPGVIGITGGKLTTFRRMAQDAVDRLADDLDPPRPSRSRWIKLGCGNLATLQAAVRRRCGSLGVPEDSGAALVRSYGDRALEVLDLAAETGLTGLLVPGRAHLEVEAVYCARAEMAVQLTDLLARRTRLVLTDRGAGVGPGSRALDLLAGELGWSRHERTRQLEAHVATVEAERGAAVATPQAAARA